jgi:phage terminase large subunit-like protein
VSAIDVADFGDLMAAAAEEIADEAGWDWFFAALPEPVLRRILTEFFLWQTHGGQAEPPGDWRVWLLMAGRGFGKTLVGAEWISARAREMPGARIALVGGSREEVARVMVEGPSGLLAVARADEEMVWLPTRGVVTFASGAEAFVYSAAAPETLRGPEHHFAWCDELAKWPSSTGSGQARGDAAWDNLQMGMRLGERPRLIVTTTPRVTALVRRVRALKGTVETQGRTAENVHSSAAFREWAIATYGGTRLGRQELDGVLFDEPAGALWTREMLEKARVSLPFLRHCETRSGVAIQRGSDAALDCRASLAMTEEGAGFFKRIVIGVDPPASADGDACGIVVAGLGLDGNLYVLADLSVTGLRPEGWARAVAKAAEAWGADRVIAEKNQGGDMVASVLASVDDALPVRLVSASRGKVARAEPVAARFETGRARLAGRFPELEDELAGLTLGGGYEGPGRSPDRADAMVWALSALMKPGRVPRVRGF